MRLPYARVEFTSSGDAMDQDQVDHALELVATAFEGTATDVLLVAHGWNNGLTEAENLIEELTDNLEELATQRTGDRPAYVVLGVLWPSMRWTDSDELAGGGLSVGDDVAALRLAVAERVEDPVAAEKLDRLAGEVDRSVAAREEFVRTLQGLLPPVGEADDDDPVPELLRTGATADLMAGAAEAEYDVQDGSSPPAAPPPGGLPPGTFPDFLGPGAGGPDTSAAGLSLGDFTPSLLARRLLNLTTYYTMKDRAGKVGARGVAPLIDRLSTSLDTPRLHLAGHSFGARVMTMAADRASSQVATLTLLQAAFSHSAFSGTTDPPGAFRAVLTDSVTGPLLVTHTHNDKAVRVAYAVASRLARQVGSGLGDANDPYGGLGANGAVATDGVVEGELGGRDASYTFANRKVHNLRADQHISGHGDVRNDSVANAWLQAILTR